MGELIAIVERRWCLLRDVLRQSAVFSTFHVETLDLSHSPSPVLHLDRGILLFLQKEESLENTVQVDFKKLITIIHSFLNFS
jgi:hypothetical protein